jgi:hypothetical protein
MRAIGTALPAFERMGVAKRVEPVIATGDAVADPRIISRFSGGGARCDDIGKGVVAGDGEFCAPEGFGQRAAALKAIEWQDGAFFGFDPENITVITRIGHRKNAAAIGQHQQFWIQGRGDGGVHGVWVAYFGAIPKWVM